MSGARSAPGAVGQADPFFGEISGLVSIDFCEIQPTSQELNKHIYIYIYDDKLYWYIWEYYGILVADPMISLTFWLRMVNSG